MSLKSRISKGPKESDTVTVFNGSIIKDLILTEYGETFSISGTYSLLHRLGFALLNQRPQHEKNDPAAMALWKRETLPNKYQEVCTTHSNKKVEIWFQDEMRFGEKTPVAAVWCLKGTKPKQLKQLGFRNSYIYGAVNPTTGERIGLVYPGCNSDVMNIHLDLVAQQVGEDRHIILVLDQAGWHESSTKIKIPKNITLLSLPPYSPELNPVERLWRWLKNRYFKNRLIAKNDDLEKIGCDLWQKLTDQTVKSICRLRYKPFTNF